MIKQYFPDQSVYDTIEDCIASDFYSQTISGSFSQECVDFLDSLSKNILSDLQSREFPEVVAFAFWIRKSAIKKKIGQIQPRNNSLLVPRGLAFHVAPSNVDIMFLYSWVISLLAGNLNIIRISQEESELSNYVLGHLRRLSNERKFISIKSKNVILTYERDEIINRYLSSISDVRVLWGGDATVKSFKQLPSPAHCKDISFSDKFSFSVLKSENYNSTSAEKKEKVASNFYNDSFWFDQMACSSPQIVFFTGNPNEFKKAALEFKTRVDAVVDAKRYEKYPSLVMDHLVRWYEVASEHPQECFNIINSNSTTFIEVDLKDIDHEYKTCGGGFFLICRINNLKELLEFKSRKDQTMGYFGFEGTELKEFIEAKGADSPCRLVPIGSSLDFDVFWDGYDLFTEFVKVIRID